MTKRNTFSVVVCGAILASGLVSLPVLASGPVDISIIEVADDGVGGYKAWEDITSAMPGETYSAIPRIKNNGEVPVKARMCLAESGVDAEGNLIVLDEGTFTIDINDGYWTLDTGNDSDGSVSSPIAVCYRYNTELTVGEVTEPLFTEVSLSGGLGNEHSNATFNLHLYAEATGDSPDEPVNPEADPSNPDTGVFTNSEPLTIAGYVSLSAGLLILIGMIIYLTIKSLSKK